MSVGEIGLHGQGNKRSLMTVARGGAAVDCTHQVRSPPRVLNR